MYFVAMTPFLLRVVRATDVEAFRLADIAEVLLQHPAVRSRQTGVGWDLLG